VQTSFSSEQIAYLAKTTETKYRKTTQQLSFVRYQADLSIAPARDCLPLLQLARAALNY